MKKHVRILGWLQVALGIMDLLFGLAAFGLLTGLGAASGDVGAFGFLAVLGGFAGAFMLMMALPNLLCGIGLLRNWGGWVIYLAVFLAFLNLAKPPFGTAISIYTFWIAWKLYNVSDEAL